MTTERNPAFFDYFAGALLCNSLSSMALYLVAYIPVLALALLPMWIVAGGLSAYLVCTRTTKQHLMVGFKTSIASIIFGVLMIPTLGGFEIMTLVSLFVCYLIGSIAGAYLSLKRQLTKNITLDAASSPVQP